MVFSTSRTDDDAARPWLYLGGVTVLVAVLLLLSGQGGETPATGRSGVPGGGGGGGALPVPGAPVDGVVNSPVPDGPAVTIVEDVRETMKRLPLDRNTPRGWTNPSVRPTPT